MTVPRCRRIVVAFCVAFASGWAAAAPELSQRWVVDASAGAATDGGDVLLRRLTIQPEFDVDWPGNWSLEFAARIEVANSATGLGTRDTYSGASEPLLARDELRVEIDRAVLTFRQPGLRLTLGKQVTAWGVLDGIRVTDRFDAVRRREFVFTEQRPERLSRWGARAEIIRGDWTIDLAGVADPTVNQLAEPGTAFDPTAPRLRGGLPASVDVPVTVSARSRYWRDATVGARVARRFGAASAAVLALVGPDTDPLIRSAASGNEPGALLAYPRRKLFGMTFDTTLGSTVLRLEAAHIPDQAINTVSAVPLSRTERARTLVGVGLDWDAPAAWFVNVQIARDQLESGPETLVRPLRDDIVTLRAQRGFANDAWRVRAEWIGSLSDGDGAFRPSIEYRPNDTLSLSLGLDQIHGDTDTLFGQFRAVSRLWLRLRATF